jgi:nitrite reductase/ring-hydroxylating ferredoxin subunit
MAEFIKLARCEEVPEGTGKVVEACGRRIALFNAGGEFYATADECLHEGGSLGEGMVYGTRVACPLHGWEYDFTTGCNVDDSSIKLRCFKVQIVAGDVLIET